MSMSLQTDGLLSAAPPISPIGACRARDEISNAARVLETLLSDPESHAAPWESIPALEEIALVHRELTTEEGCLARRAIEAYARVDIVKRFFEDGVGERFIACGRRLWENRAALFPRLPLTLHQTLDNYHELYPFLVQRDGTYADVKRAMVFALLLQVTRSHPTFVDGQIRCIQTAWKEGTVDALAQRIQTYCSQKQEEGCEYLFERAKRSLWMAPTMEGGRVVSHKWEIRERINYPSSGRISGK